MAGLFDDELERQRRQLQEAGVTPQMIADAPNVEAANSLLPVPLSPLQKMIERDGKGKTFGKMLLGGFTGMTPLLMPELIGGNARYKAELDVYNDQMKRQQTSELANPFREMLGNEDKSDDFGAIEQLATLYPDIYGPVLRDMQKQTYAPTPTTYTEGDFQYDPNYDNGAGKKPGRYFLGRPGSDGTYKKDYQPEGFVPSDDKWSPDSRETALGEVNDRINKSGQHINELSSLGQSMDDIGAQQWTDGLEGKLGETWKDLSGAQDNVTMARTQYRRIRNALAVQNLPPGVASDKDIAMVLEGFPSEFTNFEQLRTYIAAMERAERKIQAYYKFESNYMGNNDTMRGMREAWESEQDAIFRGFDSDDDFKLEFERIWGR